MIFPIQDLIEYDKNMYEITAAAVRRSYQLSTLYAADEDQTRFWMDDNNGKVVSIAARQVFTGEVEFRLNIE